MITVDLASTMLPIPSVVIAVPFSLSPSPLRWSRVRGWMASLRGRSPISRNCLQHRRPAIARVPTMFGSQSDHANSLAEQFMARFACWPTPDLMSISKRRRGRGAPSFSPPSAGRALRPPLFRIFPRPNSKHFHPPPRFRAVSFENAQFEGDGIARDSPALSNT